MHSFKDYEKYRWFFTSSGKLVIGGKSAAQNDELLSKLKSMDNDFILMHTQLPGSPFSVILSPIKEISKSDIDECAIFTGCFSRAWKEGKKQTLIHIFSSSQIYKLKNMKQGTWGVKGKVQEKKVELKLALTRQAKILRAVPIQTIKNKKDIILIIYPGKIDKSDALPKIEIESEENFSKEEVLSALPAGGLKITKT